MSTKLSIDAIRPATRYSDEVERMLAAMRTIRSKSIAYVAVPVTGGQRHIQWLNRNAGSEPTDREDLSRTHQSEVVRPNLIAANAFCERVQSSRNVVCINPAQLYEKHWRQDDYRHFWSRVIESFGTMMYLADGWNLSVGCLFECYVAIELELPMFVADLNPFLASEAVGLALGGARQLQSLGESGELLEVLIEQFENLIET